MPSISRSSKASLSASIQCKSSTTTISGFVFAISTSRIEIALRTRLTCSEAGSDAHSRSSGGISRAKRSGDLTLESTPRDAMRAATLPDAAAASTLSSMQRIARNSFLTMWKLANASDSRAPISTMRHSVAAAETRNSYTNRDLPIPASPTTPTHWPVPARTRCQTSSRYLSSCMRPVNGVSPLARRSCQRVLTLFWPRIS